MKDPTLRPGDADLEDWRKKEGLDSSQAAKPIPTPDSPSPAQVTRPTSAASAASGASAGSDASSSKKKKKGKKASKEPSSDHTASVLASAETSKTEAETSKTDSLTDEGEADPEVEGKKEKPKKKGGKKKGSQDTDDMGQTAESFASAASAATAQSAVTDETGRGIVLHPGLLFYSPTPSGRGVRALEDVDPDDLLCLVPLEACLGHELWKDLEEQSEEAMLLLEIRSTFGRGVLSCALLLLREFGLGTTSPHAAFLKTIPTSFANLPRSSLEDPSWKSTESGGATGVSSLFSGPLEQFFLEAFYVRGKDGGSLGKDLHIVDAGSEATIIRCQLEGCAVEGLAFVMRAIRSVPAGHEIFNTYGPLPSARLLSSFGFVTGGTALNPYDVLGGLGICPRPRGQECCAAALLAQLRRSLAARAGALPTALPPPARRARAEQRPGGRPTRKPRLVRSLQLARHMAKPAAKKEPVSPSTKLEVPPGAEPPGRKKSDADVVTSAADETEVVVPGKASPTSPKPTDSARASPKKGGDRSRSPKPEVDRKGADFKDCQGAKRRLQGAKRAPIAKCWCFSSTSFHLMTESCETAQFEAMGGSFNTQFCWAGMYGGMNGTGLRPKWKDNPRLPQLVGKQSTDDLHTPCYVRHAYRHGTVAVGPPYKLREPLDARSPAWTAARLVDASIEKQDWEHRRQLGPAQGIREMCRTAISDAIDTSKLDKTQRTKDPKEAGAEPKRAAEHAWLAPGVAESGGTLAEMCKCLASSICQRARLAGKR
eukprot:g1854.t1